MRKVLTLHTSGHEFHKITCDIHIDMTYIFTREGGTYRSRDSTSEGTEEHGGGRCKSGEFHG